MAEREVAPETWRAIPGHDGYEASDLGRIRSVDKKIWIRNRWEYYCWRSYRGRVLKTPRNGNYLRAKLGEHDNGYDVHTLVMLAFHGPRPKGKIIRHIDGNGCNNSLKNLCYGTYSDNCSDSMLHDTFARGERHWRSRLTKKDVIAIRKSSDTLKALARRYNVSPTTIHNAKSGRNWGWLRSDGEDPG